MRTVVHVNQHIIKSNTKNGADEPPLTVKDYRQNRKAYTAEILDAQGNVVARIVNRPHDPLACGARVWIETECEVRVVTSREAQGPVSDDVEPEDALDLYCGGCDAEPGEPCRPHCTAQPAAQADAEDALAG